ncbi:N-dimethylarginine dimethylaminohydrolase [Nocardia tenerifensis]|uniref:N-dimethylarginine dimethylaminohydrolase n=1 Tax=Nocardia tenerifensis TaxID=228006 RepID=A0A318JVD6_9NOCA|nr:arginine deiminase-related protein [Nocardia tenerifensis]PXX61084.1 N-dimethylarginine dimethylaminohydrolase [Nocardia tenerifensis]
MVAETAKVRVDSEFAPLRSVVVSQSEFRAPANAAILGHSMPVEDSAVEILEAVWGKDFGEVYPEKQKAWEAERDELAAVLTRHGVEVLRPRLFNDTEKEAAGDTGYANFFVRDPWFTVGEHVIEGVLQFPHRRMEVLPSRQLLLDRVVPSSARYVALPQPEASPLGHPGGGPFLEGGDVLVLGKEIFVGCSGMATNELGYRWLAKYLEPFGFTVTEVTLPEHVLHLDCAISLIRDGLMISCPARLPAGLPAALRDWEQIEVSEDEAAAMATNGLSIDPSTYLTDPEFERVGKELEGRGITVEYIDFSVSRLFGGAFRCTTQPLLRAD